MQEFVMDITCISLGWLAINIFSIIIGYKNMQKFLKGGQIFA